MMQTHSALVIISDICFCEADHKRFGQCSNLSDMMCETLERVDDLNTCGITGFCSTMGRQLRQRGLSISTSSSLALIDITLTTPFPVKVRIQQTQFRKSMIWVDLAANQAVHFRHLN